MRFFTRSQRPVRKNHTVMQSTNSSGGTVPNRIWPNRRPPLPVFSRTEESRTLHHQRRLSRREAARLRSLRHWPSKPRTGGRNPPRQRGKASGRSDSRQVARLNPEERLTLEQIRETARERSQKQRLERESAVPSLDCAKQHAFECVSVALDHELLTEALRHGRGRIDLSELKGEFLLEESTGRILQAGKEVATRESLDRERETMERINRGIGQFERLGGQHEFAASARLRHEQKRAIKFVLDSRDLAVNIRGAAGTGKTATLEELQRGLEESGREVLAVAPTMNAVEELQKVGFSDANTVERLLQDQSAKRDVFGKALIVDEAGMVSGRKMSEPLKLADQQSMRIISVVTPSRFEVSRPVTPFRCWKG